MRTAGRVIAVVHDREETGPILADLALTGIHAAVRTPEPGPYRREDTTLREHVRGAERGVWIGLGLGALVGVIVVLTIGAARDLGAVTQVLLIGGIALQGTIPAIMWRMGRADHLDDDPATIDDLTAEDRLLVVDAVHDEVRARHVLERHGAVMLLDERPASR